MTFSDIPFHPSTRTLRQFAGLWVVFFALLAFWHGYLRENWVLFGVFAALAVTVGPLGLIWPPAVRLIFVGWMILAFPIGWTVSRVLLAILYYGLLTPIGLAFRLARRDTLALRPHPEQTTYWTDKPAADAGSYFRQF